MGQFIKNQPPALLMTQLNGKVHLVREEMGTYIVDLSEEEKKGRSMAEGREGIVRLVSKVALAHNESLGKRDNAQELEDRLNYDGQLENLRQSLNRLMEAVTETQLANSMDCMVMYDRYLGALQNDRNNNSNLDLALREVDEWNKRFGARPNADKEPTPTAGSTPNPAQNTENQ